MACRGSNPIRSGETMYKKEVIKIKNGETKIEMKECHPRQLPLTSKYIAPYWFRALQNVNKYSKKRELREVHKLTSDDRIAGGLKLYRDKKILENTVTRIHGGDVHAVIQASNNKDKYTVIVKNYLPEHPPQYVHEREEYLANLYISCSCKDFSMGLYKDNSSMLCRHVCAILWQLIFEFNMPKIFITPEEHMLGWKKSNVVEIETKINALPLVKFRQYLNILILKQFHGLNTAFALSLHRVDNETNQETSKPQYLTFTELSDMERILRGVSNAYYMMLRDHFVSESDIQNRIRKITGIEPEVIEKIIEVTPKKRWWMFWKT